MVEEVPRDYPQPTVMLEKFLKEGSVPVAENFDARVSRYKQVMMEIVIPEMDPLDTERILAMRRIGGEIGRILTRYKASVRHVTAWRGGQGICKGDERTLLPIRWNGCGHGTNIVFESRGKKCSQMKMLREKGGANVGHVLMTVFTRSTRKRKMEQLVRFIGAIAERVPVDKWTRGRAPLIVEERVDGPEKGVTMAIVGVDISVVLGGICNLEERHGAACDLRGAGPGIE